MFDEDIAIPRSDTYLYIQQGQYQILNNKRIKIDSKIAWSTLFANPIVHLVLEVKK